MKSDDPLPPATWAGETFGIAAGIVLRLRRAFDAADPQPQRVWIFGSRARGFARPESDIDLAVDAPDFTEAQFGRFKSLIEDLELIYRIDVLWLQGIHNERLRDEILAHRRLFWQGAAVAGDARTGP
jgi:predicted nucleotidyltransferase